MNKLAMHTRVAAATVKFYKLGGQGVLVPGNMIVTAAHVVEWSTEGGRMTGPFTPFEFYEPVETADGSKFLVEPLAVEPVSDFAVFGAPDDQACSEEFDKFEAFCDATRPVELDTSESVRKRVTVRRNKVISRWVRKPFAVEILAHTGEWIAGRAVAPREIETEVAIQSGTSGGPVITMDGKLLGVVSWGNKEVGIARPYLDAPLRLARLMNE